MESGVCYVLNVKHSFMRLRKLKIAIMGIIAALACGVLLPSCGAMHSYWGVENDYYYDGHSHGHHHKPPKPPKHHKKHKKHKKHHHHDDD